MRPVVLFSLWRSGRYNFWKRLWYAAFDIRPVSFDVTCLAEIRIFGIYTNKNLQDQAFWNAVGVEVSTRTLESSGRYYRLLSFCQHG